MCFFGWREFALAILLEGVRKGMCGNDVQVSWNLYFRDLGRECELYFCATVRQG